MDTEQPIVKRSNHTVTQTREERRRNVEDKKPAPHDKFYFVCILMVSIGLTSLMVASYIFSANDVSIVILQDSIQIILLTLRNQTVKSTVFRPSPMLCKLDFLLCSLKFSLEP